MGEGELPLEASISWGDGTTQTIASLNPNTLLTIVQPLRN
jgi:hypothetical protein